MNHYIGCCFSLILVAVLAGCFASDPVAGLLKSNGGFAVVRPPSDGEYLGDVHRNKNLLAKSISMKDVMSPDALKQMMDSRAASVDIGSISGNKSFSLSAEAAYVGIAKGDLEIKGARKYSVSISNPLIYDSPFDSHLVPVLIPQIKNRFPDVNLEGKYIVRSLLRVDGLEYQFFREDGGKINISADQQLVKNLTAKLGTEWKITNEGTLKITKPRYIGYRLARVDKDGGVVVGAAPGGTRQKAAPGTKVSKVPISEHEDRDLREARKKAHR